MTRSTFLTTATRTLPKHLSVEIIHAAVLLTDGLPEEGIPTFRRPYRVVVCFPYLPMPPNAFLDWLCLNMAKA